MKKLLIVIPVVLSACEPQLPPPSDIELEQLEMQCEQGNADACSRFRFYAPPREVWELRKSCRKGDRRACEVLAKRPRAAPAPAPVIFAPPQPTVVNGQLMPNVAGAYTAGALGVPWYQ